MNCLFKGFTRIVSKITGFVNYITVKNMMRYHPVFDRNSKRTEKFINKSLYLCYTL